MLQQTYADFAEMGAGRKKHGADNKRACWHEYVKVCGLHFQSQTELAYISCGYAGGIPAAKAADHKLLLMVGSA